MSNAIALPRAKRRKRKPMPPWLKWYIAIVVLDVVLLAKNVWQFGQGDTSPVTVFVVVVFSAFLAWDWPKMRAEWNRWRKDDQ